MCFEVKTLNSLKYDDHLRMQKSLFGTDLDLPDEKIAPQHLEIIERQAKELHALAVFNPLRDWVMKSSMIAEHLSDDNAKFYMRYGLGRRFGMVWYAYRTLIFRASQNREEPLNNEDQQDINQAVNTVRRQSFWDSYRPEIREALANRVDGIMRPRFDGASVFVGWSVV